MPKHIDYTGGLLLVDASMLDPETEGFLEFPILAIDGAAEGAECDFCIGKYAVYEVDAESALGDAGHNTLYCQECATASATAVDSPDEWLAKGTFEMREYIVWKGEYDKSEFSILHTAEADVNGRPDYVRVVEYLPYATSN